jgi:oligopeptide transport system substrate-binding protein
VKWINIFCIFLVIFCEGCQSSTQSLPIKTITLNLQEGDPPTCHPYKGVDLRSRCLFLSLFEPLMRSNHLGDIEYAAAQSVEIDPSQTIYTFHIRPHRWSDGSLVTAYHFEKAWKYALTPGTACIRPDLLYVIKNAENVKKGKAPLETLGIAVPDSQTLVVTLEHPTPYFLNLTATSFFCPLYTISEAEPDYFNGPYQIKQHIPDQKLVFESNPYYWDIDALDIQEIHFTMVRDPSTALAMYQKGELDLVGDPFSSLPLESIPEYKKSQQFNKKTISRIFYLLLNTEIPALQSKSIRKALSSCINRELLVEHLFFDEIPTISCLPKTLSGLNDQEILQDQSPLAFFEEGLQELNLDREHFPTIVLSYAELSGQKKLAEFLQEQWKSQLGIEVELICHEWNIHSANLKKGNYQIGTLHLTTLYPDSMFYFDLFRDKDSPCNYCRWQNESFAALLKASEYTCDPKVRQQYLIDAERQLLEEMPVISLFTQNVQYLKRDHLNLEISNLGIYDFKHASIQ